MKTKYTSGPWINEKIGHIVEVAFPSKILATVNIRTNEEIIGTANAKLIASAPELLEALKDLLLTIPDSDINFRKPEIERAKLIIKKATE